MIGIDDITVYIPKLFVSTLGDFADSRGIEPAKLARGIGIEKMAIPDLHEDAATMAANSLLEMMQRNHLKPKQVGRIYVGTESGVDEAKAIGTYVIGMLEKIYGTGSFQECSTVEFKSACIGTTHALENVSYWLGASGDADDKVGIVVASDVAKYELNSPGEYTQGAGSVSLLVKKNPRLMTLEPTMGIFTRDENDFFRPIGRGTAVVNGKYSNYCYLTAMQGAFDSYRKKALNKETIRLDGNDCITDHLSHLIFHIPYPRMAEYAVAAIFRQEWSDLTRWKLIEDQTGKMPRPDMFEDLDDYLIADNDFRRKFTKTEQFQKAYKEKVKESTLISAQVGNIYTGSIYLGLMSLLELGKLVPGKRVGFGSYGSGCSAMVFTGIVQPETESFLSSGIFKRLDERREIDIEDYEQLHRGERKLSILPPSKEFALANIDKDGYRHYDFVN
jgi:hydroxymethylglutaryl-CoA synthase